MAGSQLETIDRYESKHCGQCCTFVAFDKRLGFNYSGRQHCCLHREISSLVMSVVHRTRERTLESYSAPKLVAGFDQSAAEDVGVETEDILGL